jgi:hypothetical protein
MSFIYEKSRTWRRIVLITKQSPLAMAGFTAVMFAGSWYAGKFVMQGTNGEMQGPKDQQAAGVPQNDLEAKLRRRMTIDHQVMARANKERLAVLLGEIQRKEGGEDRYKASLDGRSLGTHSRGTTTGVRSIDSKGQGARAQQ